MADSKGTTTALLCMDGSKYADYAFDWYLSNVHKPGDSLILLHCVEFHIASTMPAMGVGGGALVSRLVLEESHGDGIKSWNKAAMGVGGGELVSRLVMEEKQKAAKYLEELKEKMHNASLHGKIKQSHGLPRDEILRVAHEENVNLIITGTRGLGTVRRTLLGSVSDHVLHHSHVPVLVCRHEDDHHHGH